MNPRKSSTKLPLSVIPSPEGVDVEDEKVMVEEANCYLLKVTAIKASLT